MKDEAAIIADVKRAFGGLVAPGAYDFADDAAMIPPVLGARSRVITTDVVVEGVDFDRALYPSVYAGFRALAQNLSDVAAMGAFPIGFVWSLAIPPAWLDDAALPLADFVRGAAILAKLRTVPLFGGDLSSTSGPLVCSITAWGDVDGVPVRRAGANAGDDVYASAPLGASARGLAILRAAPPRDRPGPVDLRAFEAWLRALPGDEARCVRAHLSPLPADGREMAGVATACIDVSDGLALDAHRLARASGVRIDLDALDDAVAPGAARDDALFGGEDYALLFTVPKGARAEGLRIGRVVDGEGVWDRGARVIPRGFDHFAR